MANAKAVLNSVLARSLCSHQRVFSSTLPVSFDFWKMRCSDSPGLRIEPCEACRPHNVVNSMQNRDCFLDQAKWRVAVIEPFSPDAWSAPLWWEEASEYLALSLELYAVFFFWIPPHGSLLVEAANVLPTHQCIRCLSISMLSVHQLSYLDFGGIFPAIANAVSKHLICWRLQPSSCLLSGSLFRWNFPWSFVFLLCHDMGVMGIWLMVIIMRLSVRA